MIAPPAEIAAKGVTPEQWQTAHRHALWRVGDLSYHCSLVQERARALVYEHPSRRIVWMTNRRFGKSRTDVVIAYEKCLAFPGVRIPYAAETGQQVEEFVEPHLLELGQHAPPDMAPEQKDGEWIFPPLQWVNEKGDKVRTKDEGGVYVDRAKGKKDKLLCSRVAPKGCENRKMANRLRGPGTVFFVIDEAGFIPCLAYVIKRIVGPMFWEARSRWGENTRPKMLITTTPPEVADHPFVQIKADAEAKGAYFHADVYDCDHLNERDIEEAIEEAGGEDSATWRSDGLALIEPDPEHVVVPEFAALKSTIVAPWPRPPHVAPCVIGDHGYVDLMVLAFGYYDFLEHMDVIEDELVLDHSTSDEINALAHERAAELWGETKVSKWLIDAPPQTRADMSRDIKPKAEQDEDPDAVPEPYWRSPGKVDLHAAVNKLRVRVKQTRLRIHPRCKTIIAHMEHGRWNNSRTLYERVEDAEGRRHHYDGLSTGVYFNRDLDRSTNPYPKLAPGVKPDTHWINPALTSRERDLGRKLFGRGKRR